MMALTNEEKHAIILSLPIVCEDMLTCDRDKSYKDCEYEFIPNPFSYQEKSKKVLRKTKNYIRVYYRKEYLGIAFRSDPRFDSKGEYIGEYA